MSNEQGNIVELCKNGCARKVHSKSGEFAGLCRKCYDKARRQKKNGSQTEAKPVEAKQTEAKPVEAKQARSKSDIEPIEKRPSATQFKQMFKGHKPLKENPYRDESSYGKLLDFAIRKRGKGELFSRAQMEAYAKQIKTTASGVGVVLSSNPDNVGNMSAQGHIYYFSRVPQKGTREVLYAGPFERDPHWEPVRRTVSKETPAQTTPSKRKSEEGSEASEPATAEA